MQQPQAAPVQPVSMPTYGPAQGAQGSAGPQQQFNQTLVGVARVLEQAIPAYQIMYSVASELWNEPAALPGLDSVVKILEVTAYHHQAALGSIRRLLAGEVSPTLLATLATNLHQLARAHQLLGPQVERIVMATALEQRTPLTQLSQYLRMADALLSQSAPGVQMLVGPQVWQSARARVFGELQPGLQPGIGA